MWRSVSQGECVIMGWRVKGMWVITLRLEHDWSSLPLICSQPELFDCKNTHFLSRFWRQTCSPMNPVYTFPVVKRKKKSKYWSLNHQQLTEPNPCIKRQLTQNKKKVMLYNRTTYWFSLRLHVLIGSFFGVSLKIWDLKALSRNCIYCVIQFVY